MAELTLLGAQERPCLVPGHPLVWLHELPRPRDHGHAHALLRSILASYLNCLPDAVALRCLPGHAPYLEDQPTLSLSLSYAGNLVVTSCCLGFPHAVDLVQITPLPDWRDLAGLYLGPEPLRELEALPQDERDRTFALHWSRLEARSKCLGLGLEEYSRERELALAASTPECLTVAGVPAGYCLTAARQQLPLEPFQRN